MSALFLQKNGWQKWRGRARSSPRTAPLASSCSSNATGGSRTILGNWTQLARAVVGIARHEWAHRPFRGLILFLFCVFLPSPIFLAFLHPLASFPLSCTLQLEQSFPWAPLRIKLAIKNFPRELPTSLPLWSPNHCWDDQWTVNTDNYIVPLFNQKTLFVREAEAGQYRRIPARYRVDRESVEEGPSSAGRFCVHPKNRPGNKWKDPGWTLPTPGRKPGWDVKSSRDNFGTRQYLWKLK